MDQLSERKTDDEVIEALQQEHPYLQPEESPYEAGPPARYSRQARSGLVIRDLLSHAPRCAICGGFIPSQAIKIDHIHRREDGGLATADNAQLTHPYCNTGYKEKLRHEERAGVH
jgi:hypothetical protein